MALAAAGTLSTVVVGGILLVITGLVIRSMWKRKKKTGSCLGCSCGCADCPHSREGRH